MIKSGIICFLLMLFPALKTQEIHKNSEYIKAIYSAKNFYNKKQASFSEIAKITGIDAAFVFAVVAPEIAQYNIFANQLELHTLKVLYVQGGKKYANFSVGIFQMKPSFIESLELYIRENHLPDVDTDLFHIRKQNIRQERIERIRRLESEAWQFRYLQLFLQIMSDKFKNTTFSSEQEKIIFYATAYNAGFNITPEAFKKIKNSSYFSVFSPFYGHSYSGVVITFLTKTP